MAEVTGRTMKLSYGELMQRLVESHVAEKGRYNKEDTTALVLGMSNQLMRAVHEDIDNLRRHVSWLIYQSCKHPVKSLKEQRNSSYRGQECTLCKSTRSQDEEQARQWNEFDGPGFSMGIQWGKWMVGEGRLLKPDEQVTLISKEVRTNG